MPIDTVAELALPSDDFFLARQPILGRNQRLVAFELLFRSADGGDANVTDHAAATAAVISHASQLGMARVVGERLAFVNVDEIVLMSDFVRFLPHDKVILEILETVQATPAVIARVRELKQYGFKFALDDVVDESEDVRKLVDLVDIIKVDVQAVPADALPALVAALNGRNKKLLAEKVETVEEFDACMALGFEFFQGYYFARPAILSGKKIAPSELVILRLLDLINSDADNAEIERAVKRDPLISLNLLRLVNTPAAGARGRIDSLTEALYVLGRQQLQRWLQILLYAKPGTAVELNSPLLQMATTRGKLMELMTRKVQGASAETGFTVGIMSLMDALFSMSMQDILATVVVADEVRAALLERKGVLGDMLRVVELLENPRRGPELARSLKALGLSAQAMREIEMDAFGWVNELVA
ncbi:EAL and HDOD domain-containing protein [Massilia antarctica]|uniref:EAL and HDOD domain-containing protein n=1 Tax=Massilia antarctica TaxID=2765360 RepID=UPI0006BB7C4B|nr:EAL domain-containing protein [Massilia sp. H27-R4]MCY0914122.1 EAL domain-containing protein [Massilia sp. H27-R4]CUI08520.1 Predicted signal transduction protein [Janthinobacterium sp. CG23_2]CUU32306.1 Predicted signal transduction protein [Janthinobacterium sp. CG23_2]